MHKTKRELLGVVIKFAGDSGDGVQLIGDWFTSCVAEKGNSFNTFADFPAEIRAPAGTIAGVSGFQIHFAEPKVTTAGDNISLLVAFNPAAFVANQKLLSEKCSVVLDTDAFTTKAWEKINVTNPDKLLKNYHCIKLPITSLTKLATKDFDITFKQAKKCKNMFALGIILWLYDKKLDSTIDWIKNKYKNQSVVDANIATLKTGYHYAETTELLPTSFSINKSDLPSGQYKKVTGNQSIVNAIAVAAHLSASEVLLAGYPITPASELLHLAAQLYDYKVVTAQAEDEIAAIGMAIGAAYGGKIALCCTSGPGFDLKAEAIGFAVMAELPLVVINVQRAGPSTGMPTKMQQADLLSAVYGRHGESPVIVIAAASAADCFKTTLEAIRLAIIARHPVILLSDAMLANGYEPWKIPDIASLDSIGLPKTTDINAQAFKRNTELFPNWVIPGTENKMYTLGGLEKDIQTGNISYSPENHQAMVNLRAQKVKNIAKYYEKLAVNTVNNAKALVLTWGSSYGVGIKVFENLKHSKNAVAHLNLRNLYPLPNDLPEILAEYSKIIVVEHNNGQLCKLIQAELGISIISCNKTAGVPFSVAELETEILRLIC